jgi:hypothetical protein
VGGLDFSQTNACEEEEDIWSNQNERENQDENNTGAFEDGEHPSPAATTWRRRVRVER